MIINTYFHWCNDIEEMRSFYADILGLDVTYFNADQGWLTLQIGVTSLAFVRSTVPMNKQTEWARTPTLPIGRAEVPSLVLEANYEHFQRIAEVVATSDHPSFGVSESPGGDFFLFVRDPMGMTIEVYLPSQNSQA